MTNKQEVDGRRPIEAGFLSEPLDDLAGVRLLGSRCRACGESFLGRRVACPACTERDLDNVVLGNRGTLFTFTVCRHRPPGDYQGGEPPYAVGLVTLPDGLRIIAPLAGHPDETEFRIGMELELLVSVHHVDASGREVVGYQFRPVAAASGPTPAT